MKPAHRDPVKDGQKKRREYVWQRVTLSFFKIFGILMTIGFGIATVVVTIRDLVHLLILGFLWIMTCIGIWLWCSCAKEAKSLPHVPPVREQMAVLLADEILLRGSEEPAASPEELVRPVTAAGSIPAEELLRTAGDEKKQTEQINRG